MQNDYKKFQISLESDEGFEDLIKFVMQNTGDALWDEGKIKKRLLRLKRELGFKSYTELLEHVEKNQESSEKLFSMLEGEHKHHLSPLHPKRQRKSLNNFVNVTSEKEKKKKRRKRIDLKKIQVIFKVKDPTDQQHLPLVMDFLSKKKINYQAYKENYFLRRLHFRMRKVKTPSYFDYRKFLEHNPNELNVLVDCLSVNVTRFFRDKELFDVLENEILPHILNRTKKVRIWSAGCAIGPEPYSIAIMIKKQNRKSKEKNIHILATDISQDFLSQAKEAQYTKDYFDEMNPSVIRNFFRLINQDEYELSPQIKNLVTFKRHDLRTPPPAKDFDLIMCRNVLIYFSKPQSISLFQRFHSVLKTRGFLVLGKCELLPSEVKDKFEVINAHNRIYQRKN
ncbi:MAG: hypothetical protein JSW11_16395 [Candidatus Heimdallarchaeota archaeon]|nr:MAG: hypothetical protein JSW11_16395 [Candidatus Heimdallarchaeota archaeon]